MKTYIMVLAGGLLLSLPPAALSESVRHHQKNQDQRIDRGDRRGSLTEKEERKLEDKEAAIERERQEAREDGKITQREKKSLRHEQKELSQDIYRKKHNDRRDRDRDGDADRN
jgi:hypothetical protein